MPTIFIRLAFANGLLLILTYALGLFVPTGQGGAVHDIHFLIGLLTMLVTLLVHGVVYTYMIGTNKWVVEVARVYTLPDWMPTQSKRNKRRAHPLIMWGMLAIGATVWLGAAADTIRGFGGLWHLLMASFTIAFTAMAFFFEYISIVAQASLLDQVKELADRLRAERLAESHLDPAAAGTSGSP